MPEKVNQNPEQIARDHIDNMLRKAGWVVQGKKEVDLSASKGVAVREYQTEVGPADYVLFVDRKAVGIIEAKREEEGQHLTIHEEQSKEYAVSKLKYLDHKPLPFVYESTGIITRYTNYRDPKARSREIFHFHSPSTLGEMFLESKTLRARLMEMPELNEEGLRPAQKRAIRNLENSFKKNNPKALIQMATGAGKTFTACSFVYRLLKYVNAKRILFLVDTRNLGEQAEQEFMAFQPKDDNRKFTELYNVQRLNSTYISDDSQVCISTIQRLYSILQGKELEESAEDENPNEKSWQKKEPMPVEYSARNPIEQFDFVIIDECHRSIYNLWKQVLDYYDAFLIGLTATPDKRTFGFFDENVVSEYTYEESVTDGVNVPYDVFTIETAISQKGAKLKAEEFVDKREKLTRKKRWEQLDEDIQYSPKQLDKDIVNTSQIRNIVQAFKDSLPKMFPDRYDENGEFEVPKTLIFAKTDSHADDIIQMVRKIFGEGNDFCKKLTYKIKEDPKAVLSQFRNSWSPRIAVTVDMIATGTDIKPLEVLLFMRDVKSKNYFEQMKGRGTRTIDIENLRKVSRTAKYAKTHFVVVDAVGAIKSKKTDSRPLERKRNVSLKDLLGAVTMGHEDEDLFISLANRLIRLNKQLTEKEKDGFIEKAKGKTINQVTKELLNAYNPDVIEDKAKEIVNKVSENDWTPAFIEASKVEAQKELINKAASTFTGALNEYVENVRKVHEQIIDSINQDTVLRAEWDTYTIEKAEQIVTDFTEYIESNKDEIQALSLFYGQPYKRRELTFKMIQELFDKLQLNKPLLAPNYVWDAYKQLGEVRVNCPEKKLVALVSLIRKVCGIDEILCSYEETINRNFKNWVFGKQAGSLKFTEPQMEWLRMIKEHISTSFHVDVDDLDYTPFDSKGGRGMMWELFGEDMEEIINELNEALVA